MKTKITYANKLKDPRWQKKRLEILQRDKFTCQICGDTDNTLHIHHKKYIYGNDPWEYPDNFLITLCEDCHSTEQEYYKEVKSDLDTMTGSFLSEDLYQLENLIVLIFWLRENTNYSIGSLIEAIYAHIKEDKNIEKILKICGKKAEVKQ